MDEYNEPVLIKAEDYEGGQWWSIDVWYSWMGSPHRDYTVKVYSAHDLPIYNAMF